MSKLLGGAASTGSQPSITHPQVFSPADATRIAGYRALLDFYNGNQWEGLPAPNERRLTFNYGRVFVNKAASYLMGKGVSFAIDAPDGSGEEGARAAQHAEALLKSAYEHNALALVDLDTAVDSAVLGDGVFKVTWDAVKSVPVVTAVDPAGVVCVRQPDDYGKLLKVAHTYGGAGPMSNVPGP